MDDSRILTDVLREELATGTRPMGRPALRHKDVCKSDVRARGVGPADLIAAASDCAEWRFISETGMHRSNLKM